VWRLAELFDEELESHLAHARPSKAIGHARLKNDLLDARTVVNLLGPIWLPRRGQRRGRHDLRMILRHRGGWSASAPCSKTRGARRAGDHGIDAPAQQEPTCSWGWAVTARSCAPCGSQTLTERPSWA
jgi:hypothetical protein